MAHYRNSSYYDSHDNYASSSSTHRHDTYPPTNRRGRPAYTTVRPFIINGVNDQHQPVHKMRDDHDEHHRRVDDYVADRLIPTMLRSPDRPVEVFINLGTANLALPNTDSKQDCGFNRAQSLSRVLNAIIYNTPGCSLIFDGRRCDRYCGRCDMVDRNRHDHEHSWDRCHEYRRELDLDLDRGHHGRHPHSHSHVHLTSYTRNPSSHPLPLPGLFPIATAVENPKHTSQCNRRSHVGCLGCHTRTTLYRDGYCVDCDHPSLVSRRVVDAVPMSSRTKVKHIRETDGSTNDDSRVRVEVSSRANRDRRRSKGRSNERLRAYHVATDDHGYGDARRSRSRCEKERRSTPRYSGYGSESDW